MLAALERRRGALQTFVTDARKALASYETLESGRRKGLLPRPDLTVELFGTRPRAVADLARKRAAQGLFVVDTATRLVKLL